MGAQLVLCMYFACTLHVLCMYFTCLPVINLPTRSKTGIRASSKRPIAVLAAAGAKGSHVEEKGLGLTSS